MKKIYIILTYTGTMLSKLIKVYTKNDFSHVSIALDSGLKEMYSFGRKRTYNPFIAGFVHECKNEGIYKRFQNTQSKIIELEINDNQYEELKNNIIKFKNTHVHYRFNFIGLCAVGLHIRVKRKYHFYCAEFVKYILENSDIDIDLPELVKPEDFNEINDGKIIYNGILNRYEEQNIKVC